MKVSEIREARRKSRSSCLFVAVMALCGSAFATNYYWVGASNDWWNAASYSLTKNGPGGTEMPGPDDRVTAVANQRIYVDDTTIAFFSTIKEFRTAGDNIVSYFNITTNADLGCYFGSLSIGTYDDTYIVKDGPGTLTFAKQGLDDLYRTSGKSDTFHYMNNIEIRGGGLVLEPLIGSSYRHRYGDITVDEGCTLFGVEGGITWLNSLAGAGNVTNLTSNGSQLQIVKARDTPTVFSGFMSGFNYFIPQGHTYYTGTGNTLGSTFRPAGYTGTGDVGITGFMTFAGPAGTPSSLGTGVIDGRYPAYLLYLGTTGETIERSCSIWRSDTGPYTWDAGAYGGLLFTGSFSACGGDGNQQRLVLTGSNTVTCVVSNKFGRSHVDNPGSSFYITKKGTGTWRFYEYPGDTKLTGVIGVEEGVLECSTLRDAGIRSALGYATELYENENNSVANGLAHVDYANFLGGEVTMGTLRYLDELPRTISNRLLALKGAGRIEAPNCVAFNWSGVTSLGEGEKSLTVVCVAGQTNTFANITNGAGVVSVAKEGAGDLVLTGELSFSGDLSSAGGGTLTVRDITGERYEYYKLTFKETVSTSPLEEYSAYTIDNTTISDGHNKRSVCLNEFGLYSEVGKRVNQYGADAVSSNSACMKPGTIALEYPECTTINVHSRTSEGVTTSYPLHVGRMVDNSHSTGLRYSGFWNDDQLRGIALDDPSSWISAVVRLKPTDKSPTLYDLNYVNGGQLRQSPTAFTVSGSADGVNFEELYSTNDVTFTDSSVNYVWLSNGAIPTNGSTKPETGSHPGLALPSTVVQTQYNVLNHVRSIHAAAGSALKFVGATAPVVSGLKVDAAGSGTIDGFAFAADGALEVCGLDPDATAIEIAADFKNADGLANVADWALSVNGAASPKYAVASVAADAIRIVKHGFRMVIR